MNIFDTLLKKLNLSWISKGNSKKTIEQSGKGLQIHQEQQGVTNVFQIQNVTVANIEELAGVDASGIPSNLLNSAGQRFLVEQTTKQQNFRNTVEKAKLEEIQNPETVEQDWFIKWMEISEMVSREKVQDYLAKILSGQIRKPGTFNLRTLEVLKNMSKEEIESFEKFSGLIFDNDFAVKVKRRIDFTDYDISFIEILRLREAGLISDHDTTTNTYPDVKDSFVKLTMPDREFVVKCSTNILEFPIIVLSTAGAELLEVINRRVNEKYIEDVKNLLTSKQCEVVINLI